MSLGHINNYLGTGIAGNGYIKYPAQLTLVRGQFQNYGEGGYDIYKDNYRWDHGYLSFPNNLLPEGMKFETIKKKYAYFEIFVQPYDVKGVGGNMLVLNNSTKAYIPNGWKYEEQGIYLKDTIQQLYQYSNSLHGINARGGAGLDAPWAFAMVANVQSVRFYN